MAKKKKKKLKHPLLKVNTIRVKHYEEDMDKIKDFCLEHEVDNYVVKPNLEYVPCNSGPQPYSTCFWPWYTRFLDTDGTVYPCLGQQRQRDFDYGNIYEDDLDDIWNSDIYVKMRKFLLSNGKMECTKEEIPCIGCSRYN